MIKELRELKEICEVANSIGVSASLDRTQNPRTSDCYKGAWRNVKTPREDLGVTRARHAVFAFNSGQ
jgi:hypothetical protein